MYSKEKIDTQCERNIEDCCCNTVAEEVISSENTASSLLGYGMVMASQIRSDIIVVDDVWIIPINFNKLSINLKSLKKYFRKVLNNKQKKRSMYIASSGSFSPEKKQSSLER